MRVSSLTVTASEACTESCGQGGADTRTAPDSSDPTLSPGWRGYRDTAHNATDGEKALTICWLSLAPSSECEVRSVAATSAVAGAGAWPRELRRQKLF